MTTMTLCLQAQLGSVPVDLSRLRTHRRLPSARRRWPGPIGPDAAGGGA
jgi:hypothetical protein